jgi:hypothetical protein
VTVPPRRATVERLPAGAVAARLRWRPLLLAGSVALVDAVLRASSPRLAVAAMLDESAHVATTLLLLGPAQLPRGSAFRCGAIVGSVIIDLDHLPAVLRHHPLRSAEDRPVTHSMPTLGLVYLLAAAAGAPSRPARLGLAVGVTSHFIRDLATGGLPLFWPMRRRLVCVSPYVYFLLLLGLALRTPAAPR